MREDSFSDLSIEQLQRIDELAAAFEAALMSGQTPTIEETLATCPDELRGALLRELIDVEVGKRRAAGESPTVAEYRRRFPEFEDMVVHAFSAISDI